MNMKNKKETTILVGKIILGTIAGAGLISMALLAPNAVQCIEMFYPNKKMPFAQRVRHFNYQHNTPALAGVCVLPTQLSCI